jgi:hypothetical protein
MSGNPNPPTYFGVVIASHDTQQVLLIPYRLPHQKSRMRAFNFVHKPLGCLKHDIEYVGIAWATDLINTSFPY